MKREISFEEISDGKRYTANDMVKADCQDCKGCSACCHGMGNTVVLDPLDVARLTQKLGQSFDELLEDRISLGVVDGVILPSLQMEGEGEACAFLNEAGRCSIHDARPGICRLFPLGRMYEDGDFFYFLQVHECENKQRTKIKVRKWLDTENLSTYEQFVKDWHYFLVEIEERLQHETDKDKQQVCLFLLQMFYRQPYSSVEGFYGEFYERLEKVKKIFSM